MRYPSMLPSRVSRAILPALAAVVLASHAAPARADLNQGEPLKERHCFKPAKLFDDIDAIESPAETANLCACGGGDPEPDCEVCGGAGQPNCGEDLLHCPADFKCGDCAFLDEIVELIVRSVNELCDREPGDECIKVESTCQEITQDVFAGTTLGDVPGGDWQCRIGGRGRIMGEAALCLLRDLANPSVVVDAPSCVHENPPCDPPPPPPYFNSVPGTDVRAAIDLGVFGSSEVRQRLKLRSFDPATRTMRGFHDVKLCLPVIGCIDHEIQHFTATLKQSEPAAPTQCGAFTVDQAYVLEIKADDNEHRLEFNIPPLTVQTPIGPLKFKPTAEFNTLLKNVRSPYQNVSTHDDLIFTDEPGCGVPDVCAAPVIFPGYFASLGDLYGRDPGVQATVLARDAMRVPGWSSQNGLGGRNANQGVDRQNRVDDDVWNPATMRPDVVLGLDPDEGCTMCMPDRPELCDRPELARSPDENLPAGEAYAAVDIQFDFKHLVDEVLEKIGLDDLLQVKAADVTVRPEVGTAFASQLNVYFTEGIYEAGAGDLDFTCNNKESRSLAQVRMPNGTSARAFFDVFLGLNFKLRIHLPFPIGTHTIVNLHPKTTVLKTEPQSFSRGPEAAARSEIVLGAHDMNPQPEPSPAYSQFLSFSGRTDGADFVRECLDVNGPQPPEEEPPAPDYTPGDPSVLADAARFPCNLCIALPPRALVCAVRDDDENQVPDFPGDCVVLAGCALADGADGDCLAAGDDCFHLTDGGERDGKDELCRARGACTPSGQPTGPGDVCRCSHVGDDGIADGQDDLCRSRIVDTRAQGLGPFAVNHFETPQPAGREWRCDDPAKLGCFDVCTYDPTAVQPYTVVEHGSALERDASCGRAPDHVACTVDADCDDGNPCTEDVCQTGEFGCQHVGAAMDGAPCDDGLFCTGADQCANGRCEIHAGTPCFGNGPEANSCDEAARGCRSADGSEHCGNGVDDNGDGAIDCSDALCPLAGRGPACQCLPIGRDPGAIRFAKTAGDYLTVHGTLSPCTPAFDPSTDEIGIVLSNANGVIFDAVLPPGALARKGRHRFAFRDRDARSAKSGVYRLDVIDKPRRGLHRFRLQAFGDLSAAVDPHMTFQLRVGQQVFVNAGDWTPTSNGWSLTLPGE